MYGLAFSLPVPLWVRSFVGTPAHNWSLAGRLPHKPDAYSLRLAKGRNITAQLIGVPDNLRSSQMEPTPHEILLAELRFTDPARLPALVESSLDMLDDEFYAFIESKINETSDMEERETLGALRDAITDLMKRMVEAASASDLPLETQTQSASFVDKSDVTEKSAASSKVTSTVSSVDKSYDDLIDMFISAYENSSDEKEGKVAIKTAVEINYHRIDMRMLERLSERIVSAGNRSPLLAKVRDEISEVMNLRLSAAMDAVKSVLSAPSPADMRNRVKDLSQRGKLDDAFTLLLQANLEQARKAGVEQAARAIEGILQYATNIKDQEVDPEIRLIRRLLRTQDEETRIQMLTDAITPEASVELVDGSKTTGLKLDGKKFVASLRKLIEEYGQIDESFVLKLSKIGEESEQVARKVFDMEDKDIADYQDEAFHKRSVSIWDLEEYEHQETMEGRTAPWEGQMGNIPEKMGFGPDGKLSV